MNKERILIVSKAFYPMNSPRSFRTTELVKEFAKKGCEVTLLTEKNEQFHLEFEHKFNVKIIDLNIKGYPIFDISKGNKVITVLKRILNKIALILFEYPDIEFFFKIKNELIKIKNFDLLISIAYPHPIHWGISRAWRSKKNIAKVWVADCGDPYMGSTLDPFKKLFYFKYIEKWWCKKANFISVPFAGAIQAYYKEFHHKIKIIPQGFNFEEVESVISNYKVNEVPTFAFAGGLIPDRRDPKEFIEYLIEKKYDFKFYIFTNNKYMIDPYITKSKGKIELLDYIPRLKLLKRLSEMDFLLNINNDISTQLPSKLIDYTLTKRPILNIDSKNINKLIIDEFIKGEYKNQYKVEDFEQYNIGNVADEFLKLVESDKK